MAKSNGGKNTSEKHLFDDFNSARQASGFVLKILTDPPYRAPAG